MHAIVATVTVTDPQAARAALTAMRLNIVPRAPGFVSACWLEPIDGIGMSVIIFQTKDQATQAAAYPLPPLAGSHPTNAGDPRSLRQRLRRTFAPMPESAKRTVPQRRR